jgi:AcrR family transcriptional regulator
MPKTGQKRQNTFLRRKQIIDALRKLIIKHGSEHVTVRRLAHEVGITEGAIYRHFKSKKEVLLFLVDYIEESLIGDIEKSQAGQNQLEFLENILHNHLSSIEQRKGISFLVIAEIISLGDKKLNQKIYETLTKYISHLTRIISDGKKNGTIREDINAEMAATVFFGMIQGLITRWALSNFEFTLEEKTDFIWNIFREALKGRSLQ